MFSRVLIANRGAIVDRVIRTLHALDIEAIAVYSEADAGAPYLERADGAYCIGPAPARQSYLDQDAILTVLRDSGADAVHPGYGFLAENAAFARRVMEAGACFIGPSPEWIETLGHKTQARRLLAEHGLSVGLGSDVVDDAGASAEARRIGYPLLVKPAAGGGGIGMVPVHDESELIPALNRARSMSARAFGSDEVYLEKFLRRPRHIEFQVLGDRSGRVRPLFERDCSVQRRHQKLIEESPAPGVSRDVLDATAARIAEVLQSIGYDGIGTVEMLMDADGTFSFLEINTRLQVEHGVTEEATGIDLVAAQLAAAAGREIDSILPGDTRLVGHAIEARVYAEDPVRFLPSPGRLKAFTPPETSGVRVDSGYAAGGEITPHYDPLLAKVIVRADDRETAITRLRDALLDFRVDGVKTNIPVLVEVMDSWAFRHGSVHTALLQESRTAREETK